MRTNKYRKCRTITKMMEKSITRQQFRKVKMAQSEEHTKQSTCKIITAKQLSLMFFENKIQEWALSFLR